MTRQLILLFSMIVFLGCNNNNAKQPIQVSRDNTITPRVAYTQLSLDSAEVERYITGEGLDQPSATRIRNFYNGRNYQYAWFDEHGLTEQAEAFWSLHQLQLDEDTDSSLSARRLHENMELQLNADTSVLFGESRQQTELDLTLHFFRYLHTAFSTPVKPDEMQWNIPRRKINEQAMLDSFLTGREEGWRPLNQSFYRMNDKLKDYAMLAKQGGWPAVPIPKKAFKEGDSDTLVRLVKQRLHVSGDLDAGDSSTVFTPALTTAVMRLQRSFGMNETGIFNAALARAMNVPVASRLKQMKVNLERFRWMPLVGDGIFVNIPEFRLHVFEGGKDVLNMNIVVGKAATRTVIFSDRMENIVFSPYWNVPASIVRNELPSPLSESYLRRNHMEVTGHAGGLPVVRQVPGPWNALGGVKFVFPNRYNIYLHDTPSRHLFAAEKRMFSHGCIRIQKPFELAKYLLRNEQQWTDEKIRAAMNRSSDLWVKLAQPVPVYVVYFTSWVDEEGVVHFLEDVYGHDKRMMGQLFGN